MKEYSVVLFFSNNNAMWAAKLLKKNGIERKVIPIPRHMSSDCGYCVRVKTGEIPAVENLLKETGVEYDRCEPIM